jgi:hypothetical protein
VFRPQAPPRSTTLARAPRGRLACAGAGQPRAWSRVVPAHRPVGPAATPRGWAASAGEGSARRTALAIAEPATVRPRRAGQPRPVGSPASSTLVDQVSGYVMIVAAVVTLLATLYWTARPTGL